MPPKNSSEESNAPQSNPQDNNRDGKMGMRQIKDWHKTEVSEERQPLQCSQQEFPNKKGKISYPKNKTKKGFTWLIIGTALPVGNL